jgi:hypothetical protein
MGATGLHATVRALKAAGHPACAGDQYYWIEGGSLGGTD